MPCICGTRAHPLQSCVALVAFGSVPFRFVRSPRHSGAFRADLCGIYGILQHPAQSSRKRAAAMLRAFKRPKTAPCQSQPASALPTRGEGEEAGPAASDADDESLGRRGRPNELLRDLSSSRRQQVMKGLEDSIVERCADGDDAVRIVNNLCARLARHFPEKAVELKRGAGGCERCAAMLPALNTAREHPEVKKNRDAAAALDRAVAAGGFANRAALRKSGYEISRNAWRRAAGQSDCVEAAAQRESLRGRPSKVDDKACVAAVGSLVARSTQETSDQMRKRRSKQNGALGEEQVWVRVFTTTRHLMYLTSVECMSLMSYRTFTRILRKHFPHCKRGRRQTDVCSHCHLLQTSITPTFWKDVAEFRAQLQRVYPPYFEAFDQRAAVQEAQNKSDALAYSELILDHIDKYIDRNRAVLKKPGPYKYIPDLHEIAAKACHVLRWSVKVLKSYDWHIRSAGKG